MSRVLVTGFKPFSLLTWCTGNPSQVVAEALGERYRGDAQVVMLDADASCLPRMEALGKDTGVSGVLMLGASIQFSGVVLELEGVKKDGKTLGSSAASSLKEYARSIQVPCATAPIAPLVYWCLRSYGSALEWAEPRKIPCVFLHLNTLRLSEERQVEAASRFFERLRARP